MAAPARPALSRYHGIIAMVPTSALFKLASHVCMCVCSKFQVELADPEGVLEEAVAIFDTAGE